MRLARRAVIIVVCGLCIGLSVFLIFRRSAFKAPIYYDNKHPSRSDTEKVPLIMTWTNFFSQTLESFVKKKMKNCPVQCRILGKDDRLSMYADGIIFHERDLELSSMPSKRYRNQLYAFFIMESPIYQNGVLKYVPPNFFNVSLTYSNRSDYVTPYGTFRKLLPGEESKWNSSLIDIEISKKNNGSLLFYSNCDTNSKREDIIARLKKFTPLTEIGDCAPSNSLKCPRTDPLCEGNLLASHHFYLAFENSVCDEYVTEKFYRIENLIVPVVLSRGVMPNFPHTSFIAVDDFDTIEELGNYLNYLATNQTAYREYFKWTEEFSIGTENEGFCKFCEDLHKMNQTSVEKGYLSKSIENIQRFWSRDQCHVNYGTDILAANDCQ